jgi:hypothetical protein
MKNPSAKGSNISTTINAGIHERPKIIVPAAAIGTAGAMVASRAVAIAPSTAAVDPCAQSVRIQNALTKKTASAARNRHYPLPESCLTQYGDASKLW